MFIRILYLSVIINLPYPLVGQNLQYPVTTVSKKNNVLKLVKIETQKNKNLKKETPFSSLQLKKPILYSKKRDISSINDLKEDEEDEEEIIDNRKLKNKRKRNKNDLLESLRDTFFLKDKLERDFNSYIDQKSEDLEDEFEQTSEDLGGVKIHWENPNLEE